MRAASALIEWYRVSGVDEITHTEPRNWFAERSEMPVPADTATQSVVPPADTSLPVSSLSHEVPPPITKAPSAVVEEARRLAASATSVAELEEIIRRFDGCALKRTARNTVTADGNRSAKFLLIGEAPGEKEDAQGIPFCGPSGMLLDKMLASIGYDRTKCLITNTIYWRPPGNRQPNPEEVMICKPFVERFIALVDPALIVMVGATAAKSMLAIEQGITRLRGKEFSYTHPDTGKSYPAALLFHPSYLLRQPSHKRLAWHDLLMIQEWLERLNTQP